MHPGPGVLLSGPIGTSQGFAIAAATAGWLLCFQAQLLRRTTGSIVQVITDLEKAARSCVDFLAVCPWTQVHPVAVGLTRMLAVPEMGLTDEELNKLRSM